MFHGRECPHCAVMHPIVDELAKEGFEFEKLEVWHDRANAEEMRKHSQLFMKVCDGELKVPTFFDKESNKAICGEMSLEDLKSWIQTE